MNPFDQFDEPAKKAPANPFDQFDVVDEGGPSAFGASRYATHPRVQSALSRQYTPEQVSVIDAFEQQNRRNSKLAQSGIGKKLGMLDNNYGQDPTLDRYLAIRAAEDAGWKGPKGKDFNPVTSALGGWAKESSFGFGDEISAGVAGVASMLRGKGYKEGYRKHADNYRLGLAQAEADNSGAFLAGQIGGGLSSAAVPIGGAARVNQASRLARAPGGPVTQTSRLAGRAATDALKTVGAGAAGGAAWGGLTGAGNADGGLEERVRGGAQGAVMGGATGGAAAAALRYGVAPVLSVLNRKFMTKAEDKALDAILKRADRSGTDLKAVQAQFDDWARTGEVPETLAEMMGSSERELLSGLITSHRATREATERTLLERGRGEVDRLETAFARSMGRTGDDFHRMRAEAARARAEDPAEIYRAAHFDEGEALRTLPDEAQTALDGMMRQSRTARKTLQAASDDLDAAGLYEARDQVDAYIRALGGEKPTPQLSVMAADYIERVINDNMRAAASGRGSDLGTARGLRALRDRLRGVIDSTGLGEARAVAAERIRRGELLEEGRTFMNKGTDVEDINATLQGDDVLGIPSASPEGRIAYMAGASRQIQDELRNVPDMKGFADATGKIARTPALRAKVDAVRPKVLTSKGAEDRRFTQTRNNAALDEAIDRTSDRAAFTNDMIGNSRTAFRQGDQSSVMMDDTLNAHAGDLLSDLIIGGPGNAVMGGIRKFGRAAGDYVSTPSLFNPQFNETARGVLLATDQDIPEQLSRLRARQEQTANRSLLPKLPQRIGAKMMGAEAGRTNAENDPYVRDYETAILTDIQQGIDEPMLMELFSPEIDPQRRAVIAGNLQQRLESPYVDDATKQAIEELLSLLEQPQ